jgi:hypothetical protein
MAYELFLGDKQSVEDRLNNVRLLGPFPADGLPIGGLTLLIDAFTVTFSGAPGTYLTVDQIITEINAVVAGIAKKRVSITGPHVTSRIGDNKLVPKVFITLQRNAGFTIQDNGTANSLFGLSTTADTVVPAVVSASAIVGFTQGATAGHFALIIDV